MFGNTPEFAIKNTASDVTVNSSISDTGRKQTLSQNIN